ncbi:hypothetical protein KS18_15140 [Photorhabdus luminescens]|nr:hypothetical protein KS18_15140 [Photorhabdus luminescens]
MAFDVGGNLFATDLGTFERRIPTGVEGDGLPRIQRSFIMADAVAAFSAFAAVNTGGEIDTRSSRSGSDGSVQGQLVMAISTVTKLTS